MLMIFLQVFASDADSGPNGQIEYSIVSGNPNQAFVLDSVRGILATRVLLDREITPSYKYDNLIYECVNSFLSFLERRNKVDSTNTHFRRLWLSVKTLVEAVVVEC